jgi:menaquinone-dependent protoporphyrinogen oxidase
VARAKAHPPQRRVLVAYGSTRGGTAELAVMMANSLTARALSVDVRDAARVDDLDGYDAVIIGGALYNNRWHPEATELVNRFSLALRALPVWFFSSGPLDESAAGGDLAPIPQVRELARLIDIRSHMTFGGVLGRKPRGLGGLFSYGQVGDFRDPHQVDVWVERLVHQLDEPRTTIDLTDPYGGSDPVDGDGTLARVRRLLSDDDLANEDDAGLDVLLGG